MGECLVAGASGFVLKRTAVNDLAPAIETVMKGELYISLSVVKIEKRRDRRIGKRVIIRKIGAYCKELLKKEEES